MSAKKTAWHPPFTSLLQERAPAWISITAEVQLSAEPLRVDDLLALRPGATRDLRDTGRTMRGLWSHVVCIALLEFKSRARVFRRGDLHRLVAYGALWCASRDVSDEEPVTLVLVVPRVNGALLRETAEMRLRIERGADGYHRVHGLHLPLVLVELRLVAEHEDDDLLRWFAGIGPATLETRRWARHHFSLRSHDMSTDITSELEGYEEIVAEIMEGFSPEQRLAGLAPEQRLAGLAPEQRLAGLAPEQRLAGLAPDQAILALPDVTLRGLPQSYLDALPEPVRSAVRARLARRD